MFAHTPELRYLWPVLLLFTVSRPRRMSAQVIDRYRTQQHPDESGKKPEVEENQDQQQQLLAPFSARKFSI